MTTNKKKIIVIGHKNPDTDSICSAIAYAELKVKITGEDYIAKRAGQLNTETMYVLEYFNKEAPEYLGDVGIQVRDIEIHETDGVSKLISLKKAWNLMREQNVVTLPITTEDNKLEGTITINDIATSYMEEYDSYILSKAATPYKNILETLDGEMVVGDENTEFKLGKVLIAAANPDLMEDYIEEHDLVILGNRYESQLCAIEMRAGCIIVCEGAKVSKTIKSLALERGCAIICTPYDTYSVARLINQSMPIEYYMVRDNLITFRTDSFVEEIKTVMAKNRNRDFPVLDHRSRYKGMISRRNLLNVERKKVVLIDHNEKSQAVDGIESAEILEIIDHHRLGTIETISPVFFRNQPLGCTATIVYQMYTENNVDINKVTAGLLCAAIISDTLMFRSPTCTPVDKMAAEMLASIAGIDITEFAGKMFEAGSNLKLKAIEDIFYQDFKTFSVGNIRFGVGQISTINALELSDVKARLKDYLAKAYKEHKVDMIFFMLTNIIRESTELLYFGNEAKDVIKEAFKVEEKDDSFILKGVVSRKKQLIPVLMLTMQQE